MTGSLLAIAGFVVGCAVAYFIVVPLCKRFGAWPL